MIYIKIYQGYLNIWLEYQNVFIYLNKELTLNIGILQLQQNYPVQMDCESYVPLQNTCLNCKRYFLLAEKLPLQSMTIQFKNYSFPIKQSYLKNILLRTIVAFMNSKGGTIFMGVDDSTGQVIGVSLGRKQMDEFRLMVKQMLERVQPPVDLIKSEEVSVQFIPVLQRKQKHFYGKYIVKFIVLQGQTSKLYCISEKINTSATKYQQVQVISSFRRHNLGGVQELKGIKVINQVYEKARNPYKLVKTFHEGCNPHPIMPFLIQRPTIQKNDDTIIQNRANKLLNTIKQSNSSTQIQSEQNQAQINENTKCKQQGRELDQKLFRIQCQKTETLYFDNLKPQMMKGFINLLKNSTPAKNCDSIKIIDDLVEVNFPSKSMKQDFLLKINQQRIKINLKTFGKNQQIYVMTSLSQKHKPKNHVIDSNKQLKSKDQLKYLILFKDCLDRYQHSLQNYLQKCMTKNIYRKMRKIKNGVFQLAFKLKTERNLFYQICIKPPHSIQLNQYGRNCKIRIITEKRNQQDQSEKILNQNKQDKRYLKQNIQTNSYNHEKNDKIGNLSQLNDSSLFPSLLINQSENRSKNIGQSQNSQVKKVKIVPSLVVSSLQPQQFSKLTNYLACNINFNIPRKMYNTKQKYYIQIVFNNESDKRSFLMYCSSQPHKKLLPQFCAYKRFRIGQIKQNILIHPYNEQSISQLKKVLIEVLGKGVIKGSSVKEIESQIYWSLNLFDKSRILQIYERLQNLFRKQPVSINGQKMVFKVFLDYKTGNN